MTTVILNIDGHNERPQQYRRPNNRYPGQQRMQQRVPQQSAAVPLIKEEDVPWAIALGRSNSTTDYNPRKGF